MDTDNSSQKEQSALKRSRRPICFSICVGCFILLKNTPGCIGYSTNDVFYLFFGLLPAFVFVGTALVYGIYRLFSRDASKHLGSFVWGGVFTFVGLLLLAALLHVIVNMVEPCGIQGIQLQKIETESQK